MVHSDTYCGWGLSADFKTEMDSSKSFVSFFLPSTSLYLILIRYESGGRQRLAEVHETKLSRKHALLGRLVSRRHFFHLFPEVAHGCLHKEMCENILWSPLFPSPIRILSHGDSGPVIPERSAFVSMENMLEAGIQILQPRLGTTESK